MSTISSTRRRGGLRRARPLVLSMIGLIFLAGCSDGGGSVSPGDGSVAPGGGSVAPGGGTVNVTLQEFALVLDKAEITAGSVIFEVTNDGPADFHEFVVIKTDLDAGALPTDETGTVDEAGAGMDPKGEIEDIAVGASETLTLDLAAGNYVLICNIYTEAELESHYKEGMRIAFTVT